MGLSLNPISDVSQLGNAIGGLFGNNTAPTAYQHDPLGSIGSVAGNTQSLLTQVFPPKATAPAAPTSGFAAWGTGTAGSPTAPANPAATPNTGASSGTNIYGMNPQAQQAYQNAIEQQYGGAIQGYTGEKANAQAANPINLQDVQNVFDLQKNQAQNQADNQINTYNTQKSGIQSQQQLSLAQLADMIRGQHQGLQAQLGATGAGSSSALGMGDYALARQQNQNAAAINTQAGGNVANVNAQIQQVQNTLDPYLQSLEGQKQQQLHNIMSNYNDLMSRLESSIGQAQGEEKARLAMFGQTLSQAAADSLAALNNGVAQQKQAYMDSITNAKNSAPTYQAPALKEAPAPITAPNISPFQVNPGAGNATAEPIAAGGSLANILKQQQQNAVA